MSPSEYRQQLEAQIQIQREQKRAAVGALENALAASDDEIGELRNIAIDETQPLELRCAALGQMVRTGDDDTRPVELILSLLKEDRHPPQLRETAMHALKLALFISPAVRDYHGEMVQALRGLLDDTKVSGGLRTEALEILAKEKDPHVQLRLMESLRARDGKLAPLEMIIQFLGYDIHTDAYPLLRKILENPPNSEAASASARLLSNDPGSTETLAKSFESSKLADNVRADCARALQSLDPSRFEILAKKVVTDVNQSDSLRTATATFLKRLAGPGSLSGDREFVQKLKACLDCTPEGELGGALRKLNLRVVGPYE